MKKINLLLIFLFGVWLNVQGQAFQWAKIQGDTVGSNCITFDGNNLISAGDFPKTITLGNYHFSHTGVNSYIAKHDNAGNILLAKHIIGAGLKKIQADFNQNIIVTGTYLDSLFIGKNIFNDRIPNGTPQFRIFIAKFNSNGVLLWAKKIPPTRSDFTLATDGGGNVYLTGLFRDPITIGTVTLTPSNNNYEDLFLAKFDPQGNFQWAKTIGGSNYYTNPINIIGLNDGVYLSAGYHEIGYYMSAIFIRKYSGAGVLYWNKNILNSLKDHSISIDASENIYLTGATTNSLNFDNIYLPVTVSGNYNNLYTAKLKPTGNWKWAKKIATGNYNAYDIHATPKFSNHFSITAGYYGNPILGNILLTSNPNNSDLLIAKIDTAGTSHHAFSINGTVAVRNTEIISDQFKNKYLSGTFKGITNLGPFQLNNNSTGSFSPNSVFIAKLLDEANEINGSLYIDTNSNGLKDAGEATFENGMIEIASGQNYIKTDSKGKYLAYLPSGNYNLKVTQPANHYTFSPQNHSVSFSGLGQTQTKDFALIPIPNRNDVKISVTNITPTRPGFVTKYRITFENVGTTPLSDSLTLKYASNYLTFNSASIAPHLQQAGKIKWFYQTLQPNERMNIDVTFTVATSTPINTKLRAIAVIKPLTTDFIGGNNYDTLNHVVTGSYDPNDKQVSYTKLTPAQVANGKLLDYVIRFQNTGNDTAFTVIVRDSISSKLHMPSFEMLSASHPYTFRLLENGMAEWRFDNIKLPDSTRNERGSHGFIRYRMQPKTNLVLGDEIKSRAAIYFDYNAPVMTNYAVTRVSNITGIRKENAGLQAFELYPNPAKNYVMVATEFNKQATATISLKNLLGQTISEVTLPANNQVHYQLPLNGIAKGVYIVQLETQAGKQTQRLVVQ